MADDKRVAQDFAEASRNLQKVTGELRDFNMSAGKDIAMTAAGEFKKVTDPFVTSFQSLPGVSTLGMAGKTLFNKSFAILKDRREQKLLRERLGLTREQFGQLKKQKAVADAQEEFGKQLKSASENLLGLDMEKFDIATGMLQYSDNVTLSIDRLTRLNQIKLDNDEAARAFEQRGAAARVEADNEKMRKEEETQSIFHSIAAGIDNLAAGVANIKAEDVGMGLLAPIGLIGAVIVSFVGGFVTEVKRQFDGLKALVATFGRLFKPIKDAITSAGKSMFGNTLISAFFDTIKNGFTRIGNFLGGITTFIKDSKFVSLITDGATKVRTAIRTISDPFVRIGESIGKSVTRVLAMSSEGGVISKVLGFAKGFGATLGKLFLPVTIVMSAFDLITGFIDGFKESEGDSIVSKFIDGVGGGLSKLIGNLIGIPLDLLKDGVSWIMGKLGFDSAVEILDSFSFTDILKKLVSAPFNMLSKAVDYIISVFTDPTVDPIADLFAGIGSIADAAKDLLKSILRGILPNPAGESDGIFGFIKKAVSAVIPDGVYEFAGINPETGERIPETAPAQVEEIVGGSVSTATPMSERDAAKMDEELFEIAEIRRRPPDNPVVVNASSIDNSSTTSNKSAVPVHTKNPAAPVGTVGAYG